MNDTTLEEPGIVSRKIKATINREHIIALDFEPIFKVLRQSGVLDPDKADSRTLKMLQFNVNVRVEGYTDDPVELVEIPEVCRYFQSLHETWPFGLYFFDPNLDTLQLLVWCNASARLAHDEDGKVAGVKVPADKLDQFLHSTMTHYNSIASRLGLPLEVITEQITRIVGLYETTEADYQPFSEENLRQRHLKYIKDHKLALIKFAADLHKKFGRGSLVAAFAKIKDLAESDISRLGSGELVKHLQRVIRDYNPMFQFVICFGNSNGIYDYTVDIFDDADTPIVGEVKNENRPSPFKATLQ